MKSNEKGGNFRHLIRDFSERFVERVIGYVDDVGVDELEQDLDCVRSESSSYALG